MIELIPRTTRPEAGNKYYITKDAGGWSDAIKGKVGATGKPDKWCNTLANCVGYSSARFNEEAGYGYMKYPLVCSAERFILAADKLGLKHDSEPRTGGIMVWQKGPTLNSSDGSGHVEVVEYHYCNGSVTTSSSGYNG